MDFGLVGLDHGSGFGSHISSSSSDPETKQKTLMYGSGFSNKQERSEGTSPLDDYWRSSKLAKSNGDESDFLASKAMAVQHQRNSSLLRSNSGFSFLDNEQPQQQMLSFSCPKSEPFLVDRCSQNATLPYFPNSVSAYNSRNITGLNSGSLANNGVNMHGEKGPFTPSQWMELEQQALIYKYITANVPIPSNLLIPIRKAFDSVGFSSFPAGLLRPNAMGWGSFHLGFSNNSDPEPGRCRRTDGKKWRCSRDAVADQKYCERHINRGRHRSRKPVEGQTGHVVAGANITATTTAAAASAAASSSVSTIPCGGAASTSLAIANNNRQVQMQSLDISASNSSAAATTHINSMFVKDNAGERIQSTPGGLSLLPKESPLFLTRKNHSISYGESSRSEFGHVTSDSLLNPTSQKTQDSQHSLGQFMDAQWDRTQLSISIPDIPQGSLEFNSETNLSPLRLSREHNTPSTNNHHHKQANWIPISWETSLGGPLGEVLHHTTTNNNTNSADCKRSTPSTSSVLNLMTEGWDTSPPMGSSPTGVLQKTAFGSLSNSSAGSSPRAENNKALEGVSLCNNDVLGSAHLISSSSLPAL